MKRTVFALSAVSLFFLVAISCKKVVHDGLNSLMDVKNFSANATCPTGGLMVSTGLDVNRNNVLDSNEVTNTKYVCNGQDALSDKQIYISFNYLTTSWSTTPTIGGGIFKFNKNNYPGVDSIILVASPCVANQPNTATVSLYNITDSVPIANSIIRNSNLCSAINGYQQTGNVYNQLPNKEITLGISVVSATENMTVSSGYCYLFLYRK